MNEQNEGQNEKETIKTLEYLKFYNNLQDKYEIAIDVAIKALKKQVVIINKEPLRAWNNVADHGYNECLKEIQDFLKGHKDNGVHEFCKMARIQSWWNDLKED